MPDARLPPFAPPGPGSWSLETAHFTRPLTRFVAELFPGAFSEGFAEGTRRYGALLETFEVRVIHGFGYLQPRPVGAPPGATGRPPRAVVWLMMRLHPELRRRVRRSAEVFEKRLWREDLRRWDEEDRPASLRVHRELLAVDPGALSREELLEYLDRCRGQLRRMLRLHHAYNMATLAPVGDFLVEARAWTGLGEDALLRLLRGTSRVSSGDSPERRSLAEVLPSHAEGRALVEGGAPAAEVVRGLARLEGEVGERASAYLDVVGHRPVNGYDVTEPCAVEMPDLLVEDLRQALRGPREGDGEAQRRAIEQVREVVPAAHRARFDELLGEARFMNRLRDERALYTDALAMGVTRRALLEAGGRAARAGRVGDAADFLEASYAEMRAIVAGSSHAPAAAELAERRAARAARTMADAPPVLGPPPGEPPPAEWLPKEAQRMARAVELITRSILASPPPRTEPARVRGLAVSPGVYEGTARRIVGAADLARLQRGDVLVTASTSAAFNVALPLVGAIVTDRGGILSHAAIVAREYGVPAVVGTTDATRVIADGARVRVDGAAGEVEVIG